MKYAIVILSLFYSINLFASDEVMMATSEDLRAFDEQLANVGGKVNGTAHEKADNSKGTVNTAISMETSVAKKALQNGRQEVSRGSSVKASGSSEKGAHVGADLKSDATSAHSPGYLKPSKSDKMKKNKGR